MTNSFIDDTNVSHVSPFPKAAASFCGFKVFVFSALKGVVDFVEVYELNADIFQTVLENRSFEGKNDLVEQK